MQKQFSVLLKEKSVSHVETYVKDSDNIATQYMILSDIIKQQDYALAFEKVIYYLINSLGFRFYFHTYVFYYAICTYF